MVNRRAEPEVDIVGFAKPILINMLNRPGRLRESLAELAGAAGRPVSVDVDVHLIRPRRFDEPAGFANCGFRSNLDAHFHAATWARASGLERVLVLEDDLSFAAHWTAHGSALLQELSRRDWDLASLGYLDNWNEAPTVAALAGPDGPARHGWVQFTGRVNGAHAYFVHHSAYDRWIAHLEAVAAGLPGDDLQGPMASDGAINTFAWVNPQAVRLLAVPNMVGTRPTRSDITPGPLDRLPLVADVVEQLRRWRRWRHGSKAANFG
ncbi:MAG: hypothetical protein ACR2QK_11660 [Acidimicrobiales bacterium]